VPDNVQTVIDRALDAYASLAELGEEVEDEWSYVNDLADAWRARLSDVANDRAAAPVSEAVAAAVDRASAEIALITDPHRAIDWLSTYPQIVLVALGEAT
jgi:hypothetical protein